MLISGSGKDGDLRRNNSSDELENKNNHFMKKITPGAEASNILVGELKELDKPLSAFIRLSEASHLGDLTEVPVPTRFLFILLGPGVSSSGDLIYFKQAILTW